jgi:predicted site-specific integrase-resolvase
MSEPAQQYLSLAAFCLRYHVCRQSLAKYVAAGLIEAPATFNGRPMFLATDIRWVTPAMALLRSRNLQ